MRALDAAKEAAQVASDKKATKIVLQDLQGQSDVCHYQLICSGKSDVQTKAICYGIETELKNKFGVRPITIEGKQTGHWILLDYGVTIVHIFLESIRDFYALDKLWPKAKSINFDDI